MPLKKGKILLLDEPHPMARAIMEEVAELVTDNDDRGTITQYTGIYTAFKTVPQIWNIGNLKFIACPCTSTEHINVPEGVKLIYLDDEWKKNHSFGVTSTAEHTWSLILQLAKINRMQLYGKTLGIIGYGRIGRMVDHYAEAFEMIVHESDKDSGWPLDKMLPICDIITLHVPLNDETRGMIGEKEFAMMKDGALLVNTSRAEVVDEKALSQALSTYGRFGGYADDFEDKHSEEIQECYKTILTDHIAGSTKEARKTTDIYIANKIKEYINGYS